MSDNNENQPKQPEPTPEPAPEPQRSREIPYIPIEDRTNLNEGLQERHIKTTLTRRED